MSPSAFRTCAAIGAASPPPVPPVWRSSIAHTAKRSVKPMNQRSSVPSPTSAVPVLPDTSTPSSCAAVPVPCSTTLRIMAVSLDAVSSDITRSASSGSGSSITRPSGSRTCATSRGSIRMPPFAIVCATVAICSGVASSLSCPIAMRPTSIWFEVGFSTRPRGPYSPLGTICSSG